MSDILTMGLRFLCLSFLLSAFFPAQRMLADDVVHDWIDVTQGNCPLIISAPHGGRVKADDIPLRTRGTRKADVNSDRFARELANEIHRLYKVQPFLVVCNLTRGRLDANRGLNNGAQGHPDAERAWHAYHDSIQSAAYSVEERYGRGLYIDVHGHGHDHDAFELGYLISGVDLELDNDDFETLVVNTSIQPLVVETGVDLRDLTHGPRSLGAIMESHGLPAIPGPKRPDPQGNDYFNGGYSLMRHTLKTGGMVSGIQIECPRPARNNDDSIAHNAHLLAQALDVFFTTNYSRSLAQWPQERPEATEKHSSDKPRRE